MLAAWSGSVLVVVGDGPVHVTYTDHDFTQLTLATINSTSTSTATAAPTKQSGEKPAKTTQTSIKITSTSGHLYWDVSTTSWTEAGQIKTGDRLQEPGGAIAVVIATTNWTTGNATPITYNLTVDNLHTFYVVAGNTPVLVHNCNIDTHEDDCYCDYGDAPKPRVNVLSDDVYGAAQAEGAGGSASRDVHATLAAADDSLSPGEVSDLVTNADRQLWEGEKRVYLRQSSSGIYDVAIRAVDGTSVISFRNLTESSLQGRLTSGRWTESHG